MKPKECKTGGRLIRLLAYNGYVQMDHSKKPPFPILKLSQIVRDGITANDFLGWTARDKSGRVFRAIQTDIVDLNEKLVAYGFPPLRYKIQSLAGEKEAKEILDQFGRKVEVR